MFNTFLRNMTILCTSFMFLFAEDVTLSIDGSNLNYSSSEDIYGFQFNHNGCVSSASGGDATASGFIISASGTIVMSFSFGGGYIPAGSGTLLVFTGEVTSDCLSGLVFSGEPITGEDTSLSASFGSTPLNVLNVLS